MILWAEKTVGSWGLGGLFALAFVEASFFPVPVEALLIPLVVTAAKTGAFWFMLLLVAIASAGSVMGGVFGYLIGYVGGEAVLKRLFSRKKIEKVHNLFQKFSPGLIISFHSWKPLINYNGQCREIAEYIKTYNKYEVFADLEDHPTPGSLGEYGPEKYKSPVLTFECPLISEELSLEDIWQENQEALLPEIQQ